MPEILDGQYRTGFRDRRVRIRSHRVQCDFNATTIWVTQMLDAPPCGDLTRTAELSWPPAIPVISQNVKQSNMSKASNQWIFIDAVMKRPYIQTRLKAVFCCLHDQKVGIHFLSAVAGVALAGQPGSDCGPATYNNNTKSWGCSQPTQCYNNQRCNITIYNITGIYYYYCLCG